MKNVTKSLRMARVNRLNNRRAGGKKARNETGRNTDRIAT